MYKKKRKRNKNIFSGKTTAFLKSELENFEEIVSVIKPSSGNLPALAGFEIYGTSIPINGVAGGDHIIYVDFNKRYDLDKRINEAIMSGKKSVAANLEKMKSRAGILIADAAGHKITDAVLIAMLHQAFLTGILYELSQFGEVTYKLFENINSRFYRSSSFSHFITMIYGEILNDGTFRFINAGHPPPVIYSYKKSRVWRISQEKIINFPPIGTLPSSDDPDAKKNFSRLGYKKRYSVNSIKLMNPGDILILSTDGLTEHGIEQKNPYFYNQFEKFLSEVRDETVSTIGARLKKHILLHSDPSDDISFVLIKRT